jgi:hypothetical protein
MLKIVMGVVAVFLFLHFVWPLVGTIITIAALAVMGFLGFQGYKFYRKLNKIFG